MAALFLFQGCQTIHSDGERAAGVRTPPPPEPVITLPAPADPVPVRPDRPAEEPFREPTTTYTVRAGDTLSGIASRYALSVHDIVALNRLSDPDRIREGQKLLLPGRLDPRAEDRRPAPDSPPVAAREGQVTHKVAAGETLSHIASRYGVNVGDIQRANRIADVHRIREGQNLVIPGVDGEAAPAEPAPRPTQDSPRPAEPSPAIGLDLPELDLEAPPPDEEPEAPRDSGEADAEYRTVTVREGDSLVTIAVRWNASLTELRRINQLTEDDDLVPGQTIKIPVTR